jgi:uncharacterized SAM-binding protein YcdF (DUF218 family)
VHNLIWVAFLTASVLAVGDFVLFAQRAAGKVAGPPSSAPKVDLIVALTGGSRDRLRTGYALLVAGAAPELLVSGVNSTVPEADVLALMGVPAEGAACCITLGRAARTTQGNAEEIADHIAGRSPAVRTVLIVTDDYHLPRSLALIRPVLADVEVQGWPTRSERVDPSAWWASPRSLRNMALEWAKYRAVLINQALNRLASQPAPPAG